MKTDMFYNMFDMKYLAYLTLVVLFLFLAGVLAGKAVLGVEVRVPVTFAGSANVTASNSSVTVAVSGGSDTFALTNSSTVFYVPFSLTETVPLFNVSVGVNESEQCFSRINESISNQTAYLEGLIRGQLVPSQNQYEEQRQKLTDLGVQCENEKVALRNEVSDGVIQLNSTRTNFESVVQRQGAEIEKLRGELKTYYFLNLVLIVAVVLMLVGFAKNMTFKTLWDSFANMRGSRPGVGYPPPPPQQEVKK